jgi:hypothetical protein
METVTWLCKCAANSGGVENHVDLVFRYGHGRGHDVAGSVHGIDVLKNLPGVRGSHNAAGHQTGRVEREHAGLHIDDGPRTVAG